MTLFGCALNVRGQQFVWLLPLPRGACDHHASPCPASGQVSASIQLVLLLPQRSVLHAPGSAIDVPEAWNALIHSQPAPPAHCGPPGLDPMPSLPALSLQLGQSECCGWEGIWCLSPVSPRQQFTAAFSFPPGCQAQGFVATPDPFMPIPPFPARPRLI